MTSSTLTPTRNIDVMEQEFNEFNDARWKDVTP